jgi:hypothetical protein
MPQAFHERLQQSLKARWEEKFGPSTELAASS